MRELRNALERAVALCPGPEVALEDLPEAIRDAEQAALGALPVAVAAPSEGPSTLAQSKEQAEVRSILEALARHRNNRLRAAAELGISRMALYKKLHKYGLADKAAPLPSLPLNGLARHPLLQG
jgi:DNA-binding NtrC family response regulator